MPPPNRNAVNVRRKVRPGRSEGMLTLQRLFNEVQAFQAEHGVRPKRAVVNEDPAAWLGQFPMKTVTEEEFANTVRVPIGGVDIIEFDPDQAESIVCHKE